MPGRLTIGLYNSYDPRRFTEAHRKALARAAPLALAYGANLAAVGFPWQAAGDLKTGRSGKQAEDVDLGSPRGLARLVADSTSIGAGGAYLVELAEKGRFQTFEYPERGFPPQLGEVVLTTEHAKPPKGTSARAVARALLDGKSQLLVFGLGPHGVPKDVHAMAAWELDITRKGEGEREGAGHYSLETCTAMGAVVGAVAAHVEAQAAVKR